MLGVPRALYFFNFGFALSLIFHVSPPFPLCITRLAYLVDPFFL